MATAGVKVLNMFDSSSWYIGVETWCRVYSQRQRPSGRCLLERSVECWNAPDVPLFSIPEPRSVVSTLPHQHTANHEINNVQQILQRSVNACLSRKCSLSI